MARKQTAAQTAAQIVIAERRNPAPATPAAGNAPAAAQKAPVTVPPAPKVVALRGGAAVATVALKAGASYKTKAPHNQAWWAILQAACNAGPAPVQTVVAAGVPANFLGYCMRRGYLIGA